MLHRHILPKGDMLNVSQRVGPSLRAVHWAFGLPRQQHSWALQAHKALMVVESPAKAVKIQKFLGDQYEVLASYGHVRDLPSRSGSVDPDRDFAMQWALSPCAHPRMQAIEAAARRCSKLLLATDPDREGEAIAWHVHEELQRRGALPGADGAVGRVTFTEVTKDAVAKAVAAPRAVSGPLVDAYLARRCLDYLFGFTLSPLLWRKLSGARSAGRVQSVALRLVCERETEIEAFDSQEYWSIAADFSTTPAPGTAGTGAAGAGDGTAAVSARLVEVDGEQLGKLAISSGDAAGELQQRLEAAHARGGFAVARKSERTSKRSPPPPFITSTLQQAASSRLGLSATRTMAVAQELYEGANTGEGLITYMRTDGVNLSQEATEALRGAAAASFGANHVPPNARAYKSRSKNAQEAHEAIRPTSPAAITPWRLPQGLTSDQRRLYELIWRRAVASQMADAQVMQVAVDVADATGDLVLRANGSTVTFAGYLAAAGGYDGSSGSSSSSTGSGGSRLGEEDAADDGSSNSGAAAAALRALREGQQLGLLGVSAAQHFTKPPARYNEGSLVKALEEKGIGRPSTYAPILKLLRDRGYVEMAGRALVATSLGRVLDAFLKSYFKMYVDYDFTSKMEGELDDVSGGRAAWRAVLGNFWGPFQAHVAQMSGVPVTDVFDNLQQALLPLLARPLPDGSDPLVCPACGGRLALKPNKTTGGFLGCTNYNSTGCSYARPISIVVEADYGPGQDGAGGQVLVLTNERELGVEPNCGQPVFVKQGPYGLYVQQGNGSTAEGAPATRRAPLPKGSTMASTTLQQALELLKPPRSLGDHPDDGSPITVQKGRFGPYVAHKTLFAPLPKGADPETVSLEEALAAIEKKVARAAKQGIDPYAAKPGKGKGGRASTAAKASAKARGSAKGAASSKAAEGTSSRALSGYQLFGKEQRAELMAQQPPGAKGMAVVAAAWRALAEEDKKQWQAKAKALAVPPDIAAAGGHVDGSSSSSSTSSRRKRSSTSSGSGNSASKTANSKGSARSSTSTSSSNGSRKPASRATSSNGSRPLTGYQLFVKENGERLRQAAPPGSKAFAVAAEAWKALDAAEKAHWQDKARQQV